MFFVVIFYLSMIVILAVIGFYLWHTYGMPWVRQNIRTNKQYVELAIGALMKIARKSPDFNPGMDRA